jgi:hypothetical protein
VLESYSRAIDAATAAPEPTWWDLPAGSRALTPDSVPDDLRPALEAIGVDIRYAPSIGAATINTGDTAITIRSELGTVHTWSIGVGDHVALALRHAGEPLQVLTAPDLDNDAAEQVVVGEIPASVPAGEVAIMELTADPLTLTHIATRPPTEFEIATAANQGIDTDGRLGD